MKSVMSPMLWIVLLLPVASCTMCLSSSGKPVDWFIVYKLPTLSHSSDPILKHGLGHFYMDVDTPSWQLSKVSMNDSNQAVSYTLNAIYQAQNSDDAMHIMYNDEDPNKKEPERFGHSKGVLAFDKASGFWMVHSTPRFPPFKKDGYTWPQTATRYGQSFLCVSYSYSQLNNIAKQIMYNFVQVYDHWVPDVFTSDNPYLKMILSSIHPSYPPWYNIAVLTSSQGNKFTSFAKTAEFGSELYSDLVAPGLKSDLLAETWLLGKGKLASNCSGTFKVYNVLDVSLPQQVSFSDHKDHSKWVVSKAGNGWVCIGDINREIHQEHRGGGTVCMQNNIVWKQFNQSVAQYEHCPGEQ